MPQWEFLNFIAEKAARYPAFHLMMLAEATDLLENDGRICGVRAETPNGPLEVRAPLTVGADGRHSVVRARANLEVIDRGAPLDVLWMRLSRHPGDPGESLGRVRAGRILITLHRGDYWQCAYAIRKGAFSELQRQGIQEFRAGLATVAPFLHDRVDELKSWDDVKLLTVRVDRLKRWHLPGLLCIGDAAHAMSPVGGVGINLAVQDAVAAANRLANPLLQGRVRESDLRAVQRRREFPTRVTQAFQVFAHNRFIEPALTRRAPLRQFPLPMRILRHFPLLGRLPARLIGLGVRPEHIQTQDCLMQG